MKQHYLPQERKTLWIVPYLRRLQDWIDQDNFLNHKDIKEMFLRQMIAQ
jgi:hypothetical protein